MKFARSKSPLTAFETSRLHRTLRRIEIILIGYHLQLLLCSSIFAFITYIDTMDQMFQTEQQMIKRVVTDANEDVTLVAVTSGHRNAVTCTRTCTSKCLSPSEECQPLTMNCTLRKISRKRRPFCKGLCV